MKMVLETAAGWSLNIKWKKCSFLQSRIDFLGYTVKDGRISPGEEKTRAVKKFPTPQNIKAVQSFLGLTGFFRKFIPNYALKAQPLTNILKKNKQFGFGVEERKAVQELKEALIEEPVLHIFCRDANTELHTDASKDGFGATLLQQFENQLHPVFFWSKKTSPRESAQHSYILEVKAAYLALKKFRQYLLGTKFKLVTDCAAFKQTLKKKDVPREVAQWVLYFQEFDYEAEHRSADKMKHVDCLSRYPQQVIIVASEVTARMRAAQQRDRHLKAVHEILKIKPYENFKIKGNIIYKVLDGLELLAVPKSMETEVIRNAHEPGHFATQKTMHAIKQFYWTPHLESKVIQVINNCVKCILYNKKLGKKEGFLNCIDKGDLPLHTIHIDHLGPMDATSKSYRYIFAVVDGFTKFVWLYPTKSTSCEEVIRKLSEWSMIFGNPTRIISDRGAAFTSNNFSEFVTKNNINHVLTTTGIPRGNGQVERVNRAILSIISKLSAADPAKWFKFVPEVQKTINSSFHSSTKASPFEIMLGIKMKVDLESQILDALRDELVDNLDIDRQRIRDEASAQILKTQATYKRNFDKGRKAEIGYTVGDLVAIKRTQFVAGKNWPANIWVHMKSSKLNAMVDTTYAKQPM